MNTKQRIKQLEKVRGEAEKIQYLCITNPEDTEYKARPMQEGKGEAFTFKTIEAMTAFFDKHTELELLHVQIVYASEADTPSE